MSTSKLSPNEKGSLPSSSPASLEPEEKDSTANGYTQTNIDIESLPASTLTESHAQLRPLPLTTTIFDILLLALLILSQTHATIYTALATESFRCEHPCRTILASSIYTVTYGIGMWAMFDRVIPYE
jgi:hypothetical protein